MTDYPVPSQADVDQAIRLIPSPQLRRVFFDGLANPNWIKPLFDAGQFGSPPEPVQDEKGYIREEPWPEVDYLVRMAPFVPDAVIDVFLSLEGSRNSWVRRSAIFVGASLDPDKAVRLKPILEAWESGFGFRTDPRDLANLTRNLLGGPKPRIGLRLARVLFGPTEGNDKPRTALDEYWYEEELPGIVEALGDRALKQVLHWLEDWERLSGHLEHDRGYTAVFRPSIETSTRAHAGIEDALIDAVRDAAVRAMQASPASAVQVLQASPLSLAKRIMLYAIARALASRAVDPVELIDMSIGALDDPLFADSHFRLEIADYFRAVADVAPDRLTALAGYLDRGPLGGREVLIERLRREGDSDQEAVTRADEYTARWRHRLLATIGGDHLSEPFKAELEELDARDGAIEDAAKPDFQMTSWVGPESPVTVDDLAAMPPSDLATYLETWHPEPGSWHGPSHGGQGRLLTTLLTTSPRALQGQDDLLDRLRPTYINAILRGWEAAIRGDVDPDWAQLIAVVRSVLTHIDASNFEPEGDDFDDDRDYSRARHAAVALVEEALTTRETRRVPKEVVDDLGRVLLANVVDDRFWDEYVSSKPGDGWDPLNLSINAAWPIQAKALIMLAGSTKRSEMRTEALAALDHELARDDPWDALAAVIGESLPRLYLADEGWLRERVDRLFGTAEAISRPQQIALSTALATQYIHSVTLGLIRGAVLAAMKLDEPMAVGWNGLRPPDQLIGEWIITTHIRGQLELDDPLMNSFFVDEPANVRGEAIGHIAWEFMQADVVDDQMRARLESLWDSRVVHVREHPEDGAELKDFYWFVRSRKFDPAWWLPRLIEAATLDPELMTHGMIGEDLATAAREYPSEVLDAVVALTARSGDVAEPTMYDLMRTAVPTAIAWSIERGDDALKADARRFMNTLAERGYINIVQSVEGVDTSQPVEE
ncbi:hypothetical protein [Pseudolysinimonas sp.]|uniref:hypothetical protein n=1 Tax=Pseudolysinimonas sp. TaxID=2680009 RepID=UPI003F81A5DE